MGQPADHCWWDEAKKHAVIGMPKAFDCIHMKNRIQAEILAEYEEHKGEYASYSAFVKAKADGSEWVRGVRKKLAQAKPSE